MKAGVVERIRAAGGAIYAVTSEPQALADRAQQEWDLPFEVVGDPHHEVSRSCVERGWLELFVNDRMEFLERSAAQYGSFRPQHPKGYFQPGVLALSGAGRVLYRWRGVPKRSNQGGATERPTAEHVWERVEQALAAPPDAGDAALDTDPPLDIRGAPWPLFAAVLVANGWFVRPRGLAAPRGTSPIHVARWAMLRLALFVLAWIAAFVWLPTLPVAVALAAWIAWIVPQVRWLGREFQNVEVPAGG